MSTELKAIDLPEGWTCLLELKQMPDGTFSGKAELRRGRRTRCVLVLTQCPTRDAALDLFQSRAQNYIGASTAVRGRAGEHRQAPS